MRLKNRSAHTKSINNSTERRRHIRVILSQRIRDIACRVLVSAIAIKDCREPDIRPQQIRNGKKKLILMLMFNAMQDECRTINYTIETGNDI